MSNLPDWPGADAAYARAYRILRNMAAAGHVRRERVRVQNARGRFELMLRCFPSDDMLSLVEALTAGDEEAVKGYNFRFREYDR